MQSECEEKLVQSELASERVVTAAAVVHDHAVAQFAEHRATDSRSEQDALQQAKQQLAELSLMAGREKQCTVRDRP